MGDHLIVMHSAVRGCPGYDRHAAPAILLDGTSLDRDTEHGLAVTAQIPRRQNTLAEAIEAGSVALSAAGVERSVRRQAREACEDYFYERLGLAPDLNLVGLEPATDSLELMPERMILVLENIVDLVVDGEWEDLRALSEDLLEEEDMRRRVEDDCPEALILPSRDIYRVEAISKSDEAEMPGWAYFLDLWTEEGPARLHIEGEIEESDGRLTATLTDILP